MVDCDTCNTKFYDHQTEDGDMVEFKYINKAETLPITTNGVIKEIILVNSNTFTIKALSEGSIGMCTVMTLIGDKSYKFSLKQCETIKVRLVKTEVNETTCLK